MYSKRGWSYSSSRPAQPAHPTLSTFQRLPRLPRVRVLGPLLLAVLLVAAAGWYQFAFAGFEVQGRVLDNVSGVPIVGARAWSTRASATSGADGSFQVSGLKPPEAVAFDAPGYRAQTLHVTSPFDPLSPRLEPIGVDIDVVDSASGQPVRALVSGPHGATADEGP